MKFKLFLTLCILQFSNFLFAGSKNDPNKKYFVGPKVKNASGISSLLYSKDKLVLGTFNGDELFKANINPVNLMQEGEPKFITRKKKNVSGFVVDGGNFMFVESITTEANVINFLMTDQTATDGFFYLYYQMCDANNKPLSKPVKMAKRKAFQEYSYASDYRNGSFKVGLSKNKKNIYLINQAAYKATKKNATVEDLIPGEVEIAMYDSKDMKEINSGTFNLQIRSFGASAIYGDDGMVYTLVKSLYTEDVSETSKRGKVKTEQMERWYYKLIAINASKQNSAPQEKSVFLKDQYVYNVKLQLEEDGTLLCGGTKSDIDEKNNPKKLNGYFYFSINAQNLETISYNEVNFEYEHKSTFVDTYKPDEYNYKVIGMEKMSNGSITFLIDELVAVENYLSATKGIFSVKDYKHGNIIISNSDKSNKINWTKNFYRYEYHTGDESINFYYKKTGNKINFVFKDSRKNYDGSTLMFKSDLKSTDLSVYNLAERIAMASVDEDGIVKRKLVDKNSLPYVVYFNTNTWSDNANEFFFLATNKYNLLYDPALGCLLPPLGITTWILKSEEKNEYLRVVKVLLE